jgi:chromosome segregation ATPase
MQEEVDEMEQFGGAAGNKDEAVEMMANPMVVQMKDMQARLDKKNKEVMEEETNQRQKASEMRQEAIQALQTDRDKLAQELEEMKRQLADLESSRRTVAGATPLTSTTTTGQTSVTANANMTSVGREGTTSAAIVGSPPTSKKIEFDSKPAVRPKKKNID